MVIIEKTELDTVVRGGRTRSNGCKKEQKRFRSDIRINFFMIRRAEH